MVKTKFSRYLNFSAVAEHILKQAERHTGLLFVFDFDSTLCYSQKQPETETLTPNAHIPVGLKEVFEALRQKKGVKKRALSGRSLSFLDEHLGLKGSGQFHAEMTCPETGEIKQLKPIPNFMCILPCLYEVTGRSQHPEAYVEDDKAYYKGIKNHLFGKGEVRYLQDVATSCSSAKSELLLMQHRVDDIEIGPEPTCKSIAIKDVITPEMANHYPVYFGDCPKMDGPAMSHIVDKGGIGIGVGEGILKKRCGPTLRNPHELLKCLKHISLHL